MILTAVLTSANLVTLGVCSCHDNAMVEVEPVKVAVVGAAGRMGQETVRALHRAEGIDLQLAIDRSSGGTHVRELVGSRGPDLVIHDKLGAALDSTPVDVLVDFTTASAAMQHAESALKRGVAPVIGTTGIGVQDLRMLKALTEEHSTPAMYVPNFAIGAVLMMRFAELAARWMPDVEIIELHHENKEDAPSGTAALTAERIASVRGGGVPKKPRSVERTPGVRGGKMHDVNIHSIRLRGLVAHQEVVFGGQGETLTIRHDSFDRGSFMEGVKLCVRRVKSLQGLVIGLDSLVFD
jgi:4-hydroxy-tetrahydrodipicolinate reductase